MLLNTKKLNLIILYYPDKYKGEFRNGTPKFFRNMNIRRFFLGLGESERIRSRRNSLPACSLRAGGYYYGCFNDYDSFLSR